MDINALLNATDADRPPMDGPPRTISASPVGSVAPGMTSPAAIDSPGALTPRAHSGGPLRRQPAIQRQLPEWQRTAGTPWHAATGSPYSRPRVSRDSASPQRLMDRTRDPGLPSIGPSENSSLPRAGCKHWAGDSLDAEQAFNNSRRLPILPAANKDQPGLGRKRVPNPMKSAFGRSRNSEDWEKDLDEALRVCKPENYRTRTYHARALFVHALSRFNSGETGRLLALDDRALRSGAGFKRSERINEDPVIHPFLLTSEETSSLNFVKEKVPRAALGMVADLNYASALHRRGKEHNISLGLVQLSNGSGATPFHIQQTRWWSESQGTAATRDRRDRVDHPMLGRWDPADTEDQVTSRRERAKRECPRNDELSNTRYARRLFIWAKDLFDHGLGGLTWDELAEFSGAEKGALTQDPIIRPYSLSIHQDELLLQAKAIPRNETEADRAYARRLIRAFPNLCDEGVSNASVAKPSAIKGIRASVIGNEARLGAAGA